ncbi:hypothetical protein B0H14DRAFT_2578385 [Mycena olivaceomarginata]|nr:hypothetical protein B0H14DRAFT_2578385 [Mycena olivaceomarginata]
MAPSFSKLEPLLTEQPLYYMPVEIFDHILDLACGDLSQPPWLVHSVANTERTFCRTTRLSKSRLSRKEEGHQQQKLFMEYLVRNHSRKYRNVQRVYLTLRTGPVDLRLEFRPGPARPGKVSTPMLLDIVNTVSEQCATLKLFMVDDIDTAEIISTVHSNQFPRLSNLSITVLYGGDPSYDNAAPETPCPAVFAHFPNTPTVGEFDALLNAASNLERLSIKVSQLQVNLLITHTIRKRRHEPFDYDEQASHYTLLSSGTQRTRKFDFKGTRSKPGASGARHVDHVGFRDIGDVPQDVPSGNESDHKWFYIYHRRAWSSMRIVPTGHTR